MYERGHKVTLFLCNIFLWRSDRWRGGNQSILQESDRVFFPYILKRFHDITLEDDDTGECETVKCTNYLICKDAETAKVWMKMFVGMEYFNCEGVPKSWGCPPIICHVEGKRYMLLDYKEGYRG